MRLDGRVALVTGGAGNLGRVICQTLADLGASVVVHDINSSSADETAQALRQRGATSFAVAADLRDADSPAHIMDEIHKGPGRLDILVHNAAFVGDSRLDGWAVPFAEQGLESWRSCLEVNLTAPFALTQAALP